MATIEAQPSSVREAFNQAVNAGKPASSRASSSDDRAAKTDADTGRSVHDTVTLSAGGQKIVNLNRGQDLAQELKNAPVDQSFAETLRQATQDVFRITRLFTETVKSAFTWRR
ncbi:hypothetical protein [Magnetovibrio sp.]|uniref:hypothetical protein n=1 Tax=Magnetovibrio sp. TaxID=2024836 RepID=UPI002F94C094